MHQHAPNPVARASNEVGDIARRWGDELRKCDILRSEELRALAALAACRTPFLGGHLDICQACGFERPAYNSCRNRHCPKCQSLRQARWAETRLPTHYFHVVFTLPAPLRPIALRHRAVIFDLLFAAASRTLLELGANTERLGAQLGITAVLHTWNQKIEFHPHLHCIATGGGLTADGGKWSSAPKRFLFPVLVMGALFRGKLLALLHEAIDEGRIDLRGEDPKALFDKLYRTRWVVYCKRPFGGPEQVIRYLSRYVHRVGISNQRIASVDDNQVVFRTKSGQPVTLAPLEFLRRLLQHVLPDRFVKIRHYGLHASGNATTRLERARELLSSACTSTAAVIGKPRSWIELLIELTGVDVRLCSRCGADALQHLPLAGGHCGSPNAFDTS